MSNNLVSIIMPTYNSAKTLLNSINSVLAQTYTNLELIISDDFSSDNSLEIARSISLIDSRIVVLSSPKNNGAAIARNKAINIAKGKYISFLDSDDTWEPRKLELQISFMEQNGYDFTYTNYYVKKNNGKIIKYKPCKKTNYSKCLLSNPIGCLTAIYDCEKIGKRYMPENAIKREDFATWLSILKTTKYAFGLNEFLATYYIGKNTVSSDKFKMIKYQYHLYSKVEKINPLLSILILVIYSIAKIFKY